MNYIIPLVQLVLLKYVNLACGPFRRKHAPLRGPALVVDGQVQGEFEDLVAFLDEEVFVDAGMWRAGVSANCTLQGRLIVIFGCV